MNVTVRHSLALFMTLLLGCLVLSQPQARADIDLLAEFNGTGTAYPSGGLTMFSGTLYGVTSGGGEYGYGSVYIVSGGTRYDFYSFTGDEGFFPYGTPAVDANGNVYGTTLFGGALGYGMIWKLDFTKPNPLIVLKSFDSTNGAYPYSGVILDGAGNLYGTTYGGGANYAGTVWKLDTANNLTTLGTFYGGNGAYPISDLIRDSAGNLYGTSAGDDNLTYGTVYKVSPPSSTFPQWKLTILKKFTKQADGSLPDGSFPGRGALSRDSAGNLYGTTFNGGKSGFGTIFKISPTNLFTSLYSFTGFADGGNPIAGVIRDSAGNLYGTTSVRGLHASGTIFRLSSSGNFQVLSNAGYVLPSKTGQGGRGAFGNLYRDKTGNLFMAFSYGGTKNCGTIEKVTYPYVVNLANFDSATTGASPQSGMVKDSLGNYYGVTVKGGAYGNGTLYRYNPASGITALHHFTGYDGTNALAAPVLDSSRNLCGVSLLGGAYGYGTVWKLTPAGTFTKLHDFVGSDGKYPSASLISDSSGNLYGSTNNGGSSDNGTIFKISSTGTFSLLFQFNGTNGASPGSTLARDSLGNLYGATMYGGTYGVGTVFKLNTSNILTTLRHFTDGLEAIPLGNVVRDSSGNLYGTSNTTVWKLSSANKFSILHSFNGMPDGASSHAGLIRDSAGNIYGTTLAGGASEKGIVYKLNSAGMETILADFSLNEAGFYSNSVLLRDSTTGSLYGTTASDSVYGYGAIFGVLY